MPSGVHRPLRQRQTVNPGVPRTTPYRLSVVVFTFVFMAMPFSFNPAAAPSVAVAPGREHPGTDLGAARGGSSWDIPV
jgi:hypothetical protein